MSSKNILAIDQGTTSSRAIVFSPDGEILSTAQKELTLHYPQNGWVEQDSNDIWNDTLWACKEVIKQAGDIGVIGITNQRETTIIWDRNTGEPVYNAIVWQDRRTADLCANLKAQGHEEMIAQKTGLLLDPYFSATKIAWILDNVDGARTRAEAGELLFGTVDSFLLWKLTNGKSHATDASNASRTMLFNIVAQRWDAELLSLFNIPPSLLPEVKDNVADFGLSDAGILGAELPIGGMAGDQQAAMIGQACFSSGMVKSTYGTGAFVLMNIGEEFKPSKNRLLTTVGYRIDGQTTYALEGSVFNAGTAVQLLRDGFSFFDDAKQSEQLAMSVPDNGGVYFVPAFTGLGAPYWNPEARGLIMGLGRDSTSAHITRAALEAQAYQSVDLMAAMSADCGRDVEITNIRVDGGLVANQFVCQFLADMLDVKIDVPKVTESTAYGAAMLAGVSAGIYKDFQDVASHWEKDREYSSQIDEAKRAELYGGWKHAIQMLNF